MQIQFGYVFHLRRLVGLGGLFLCVFLASSQSIQNRLTRQVLLPDQGCTVFYGADGGMVLGGNNEDFFNQNLVPIPQADRPDF